jgi:hypothetical protein
LWVWIPFRRDVLDTALCDVFFSNFRQVSGFLQVLWLNKLVNIVPILPTFFCWELQGHIIYFCIFQDKLCLSVNIVRKTPKTLDVSCIFFFNYFSLKKKDTKYTLLYWSLVRHLKHLFESLLWWGVYSIIMWWS